MRKRKLVVMIVLTTGFLISKAQVPDSGTPSFASSFPGEPMFFLDNVRADKNIITAVPAAEFSMLDVVKGRDAVRMGGEDARGGIIFAYTKTYITHKYWTFLAAKSSAYKAAVPSPDDPKVTYIVNGEILDQQYATHLYALTKENIKSIRVKDQKHLKKKYRVDGKRIGVIITTRN